MRNGKSRSGNYRGNNRQLERLVQIRDRLARPAFDAWAARWQARLAAAGDSGSAVRARMDGVNPAFVPRNHLVEAVIAAAVESGNFGPFETLNAILARPYADQPQYARYAELPPQMEGYQTFCGT